MGFLEDGDLSSAPTIPEFFKGKTIFITGGSGFMGKVLVEKLLYSCTDLDRIYLLMRSKKGVDPEQRLAELYSSQCFDRLRRERPGVYEKKMFFIAGDVSEIGLGLSEEDRALIVNRVNIIFHVAASVRFDDSLPVAAKLNLRGTKELVELASDVRELVSFVHVSTTYANTNRDPIEEVLYPPHADWRDTLNICETLDEQTVKILTPKYLGDLPNTYVFTKQLAEHVVYEQRGKLPLVIYRPSIVISSHLEPTPGWIDNFNGPTGIIAAVSKGILRTLYTNPDLISDYIPVDVAIKGCITAAWIRGVKKLESTDDIPIYNCCSGNLNTITIQEIIDYGLQLAEVMPSNDMLWNVSSSIVTTSKLIYMIKVYLFHLLPALLVDSILWLLGKKTLLFKVQRRIYTANMALNYFITQQWTFSNINFMKLRSAVKPEDCNEFYYELENVNKFEYFKTCCVGGRRYLLKEKDEDIPKARAHYHRMVFLDKLVKFSFYGFIFWKFVNSNFFYTLLEKSQEMLS
ncbi:fatty acyl-CoA reductase 1-like [Epargyreus clarus]|uniref:fatty acyl-CoA reductase 1-like n=1 Tax=Epargyreus clarus TaxID=520877 RepID=UPI003C2F47AB